MTLNELREILDRYYNGNEEDRIEVLAEMETDMMPTISVLLSLLEQCEPYVEGFSGLFDRPAQAEYQEVLAILRSEKPIGE